MDKGKGLTIGILLCILGMYLILNHKRYGRETMDSHRRFYNRIGLKGMAKGITKDDEIQESKGGLIGGVICLIIGAYGIISALLG